ncbi:MAG: YgiQ family radical SAM protein, partial [Oscillospiraceae bacterium]|nr:YgiQ family radical SAM protein [Oscillospiraceae bacterium]
CEDFKRFGRPRLGFLVSAGAVDSMVNHYTATKRPRSEDAYAPGGQAGRRPDRATIVYCNRVREAFPSTRHNRTPIIIGGLEASLRRFAHYDYWDDKVRASILVDSGADLLLFGMCEKSIIDAARWIESGSDRASVRNLRGACYLDDNIPDGYAELPSFDQVRGDKREYARAFLTQMNEQDPVRGNPLAQRHGAAGRGQSPTQKTVCQNIPPTPLTRSELDAVYNLPFTRTWHPDYDDQGGVPALEEVRFSISATRGCFGACAFCALTYHQGRIVTSRSPQSITQEARRLTTLPGFKGYIHDVGGPTANFRRPPCERQLTRGACRERQCLFPKPCPRLKADHRELVEILRDIRALPGVKKVFIRSGVRFDYLMKDSNPEFLNELVEHHISGQLKVAPEHADAFTLECMGKPDISVFDKFSERYYDANERLGKRQYLVPYFISGHPGCDLAAAVTLAEYMRDTHLFPEQVQDFYPTPGTLSTCMYHTGMDPRTMQPIYIPKDKREKAMQRALLQYRRPANAPMVREALRKAGRSDLIGFGARCLVRPDRARR